MCCVGDQKCLADQFKRDLLRGAGLLRAGVANAIDPVQRQVNRCAHSEHAVDPEGLRTALQNAWHRASMCGGGLYTNLWTLRNDYASM